MKNEKVKRLLTQSVEKQLRSGFNSIGIINVNERIRINYGDMYGVRIKSIRGVGTVVRIIIPKMMFAE